MRKKIILITLIILFSSLLIYLFFFNKEKNANEKSLECTNTFLEEILDKEVTYKIYSDSNCDDCLHKVSIRTTYKADNTNKDKLSTLAYLIDTESKEYAKQKGFTYKINSSSSKKFIYTITINPTIAGEELKKLYSVYNSYSEEVTYLEENGYSCK